MGYISQKVCRLGNIRNGIRFRPVFDIDGVSRLLTYVRIRSSSKGVVLCVEESWDAEPLYLSCNLLVRRVIEIE